jgi:hypothetical protein
MGNYEKGNLTTEDRNLRFLGVSRRMKEKTGFVTKTPCYSVKLRGYFFGVIQSFSLISLPVG